MVISACDGINIVVHDTNTEVSVLLLQGLDLEPSVVSWVIPCKRMGSKKVIPAVRITAGIPDCSVDVGYCTGFS